MFVRELQNFLAVCPGGHGGIEKHCFFPQALDKLQAQGRKVGVISHVHEMTERIGTRIAVRRSGGGVSRVEVE